MKRRVRISLPEFPNGGKYNWGPTDPAERKKLYKYRGDQEPPDMILTLKNDKEYIDGIANWASVSGLDTINPEFNDQIKNRLYSGKWGYNPKTGYLVNLARANAEDKQTTLPESEKKYLERREDVPYEQAVKDWNKDRVRVQIPDSDAWSPDFEFEGLGRTMNANEMRGQTVYMTQQEADDYLQAQLQSSIDATYRNPIMYAPGMIYTAGAAPALDLLMGAGSSLEPLSRGDYKEAALTFGLGALPMVPGAVRKVGSTYNKVATGNSKLPFAWKMEKIDDVTPVLKNKYSLSDEEAYVLGRYIDTPYNIERGSKESIIFDKMIERNPAILKDNNLPVTKVLDHSTQTGKDFVPKKLGETFSFPGNRSWTLGADDRFSNIGKTRLVIPSKYTKDLGFMAVPYDDSRLWKGVYEFDNQQLQQARNLLKSTDSPKEIARLEKRISELESHTSKSVLDRFGGESEIIGNIPEGFKVIGRGSEGGFENIFIRPISKKGVGVSGSIGNISKTEAAINRSSTLREITNDILSISNEFVGAIKGGTKEAVEEGNTWLREWINDPKTQQKVADFFEERKKGVMAELGDYMQNQEGFREALIRAGAPDEFVKKAISEPPQYLKDKLSYIAEYEYSAKTFNPNTSLYPLNKQFKEFFSGAAAIHGDNYGVFYPGPKRISERSGAWVSRNPFRSHVDKASTSVHEGVHHWTQGNKGLLESGEYDIIQRNLSNEFRDKYFKSEFGPGSRGVNPHTEYLADPTEVHARIMELRKHYGIKPGDIITDDVATSIANDIRSGNAQIDPQFLDVLDKSSGSVSPALANLFNRLRVAVPVAGGVGLLGSQAQEQKYGGLFKNY